MMKLKELFAGISAILGIGVLYFWLGFGSIILWKNLFKEVTLEDE